MPTSRRRDGKVDVIIDAFNLIERDKVSYLSSGFCAFCPCFVGKQIVSNFSNLSRNSGGFF